MSNERELTKYQSCGVNRRDSHGQLNLFGFETNNDDGAHLQFKEPGIAPLSAIA